MTGIYYDKKLIQAAVETTYNSPATLASTDAMLASSVTITPLVRDTATRTYVRPSGSGSYAKITAGKHGAISFGVELAGSGTAGTVPAWGRLARGACRSEFVTAATKVDYSPASANLDSLTIGFNMDGQYHQLTGCRGTADISFKNGAVPIMNVNYEGIWAIPTSTAMATADFSAWQTPLTVDSVNTATVDLLGVTGLVLESLDIKAGDTVKYSNMPNYEGVDWGGRQMTGTITFQAPAISTHDWFNDAVNDTKGSLSVVHGGTAGNIIELAAPTIQLEDPKYVNQNGTAFIQAGLILIPSDTPGDDEFVLTAR